MAELEPDRMEDCRYSLKLFLGKPLGKSLPWPQILNLVYLASPGVEDAHLLYFRIPTRRSALQKPFRVEAI
jgi:hypothetical protein